MEEQPFQELPAQTNPDPPPDPQPDVWVIRVKKIYVMMALVGLVCFAAGYAINSFLNADPNEAIARPDPTTAVPSQRAPDADAGFQNGTPAARVVVNVDDDPTLGPEDAPITIVEFSDFQCPFCRRFYEQTLDQLLAAYPGEVRWVYRDFPLSIHPQAKKAAEAAECAHEQGAFWPMHDRLFAGQNDWSGAANAVETFKAYAAELALDTESFGNCLDSGKYVPEVLNDYEEGRIYGVRGTPSFFINGRKLSGAVRLQTFQAIIEEELTGQL